MGFALDNAKRMVRKSKERGGPGMAIAHVNVSVADDYLDRFAMVVQRCQKAGLKVEQQLAQIGVMSGAIDSEKLADLERVEGVAAVEQSRTYQIAPPDSKIQ
jgi:hypothetical protein